MELEELKKSWMQMDQKLEAQITLHKSLLREVKLQESRRRMLPLTIYRSFELLVFLMFIILLGQFIADHLATPQFYLSGAVLYIFAMGGLIGAIGQLYHISQINYAEPIVSIQKKLRKVETHRLHLVRLTVLSVPFYMAYVLVGFEWVWGIDLYLYGNQAWWYAQLTFSALLIPLAIWVRSRISFRYMHLAWVRKILQSDGAKPLQESLASLEEIRAFEEEARPRTA
jgi:hypothetical protein